jgi:hypothetical protein
VSRAKRMPLLRHGKRIIASVTVGSEPGTQSPTSPATPKAISFVTMALLFPS